MGSRLPIKIASEPPAPRQSQSSTLQHQGSSGRKPPLWMARFPEKRRKRTILALWVVAFDFLCIVAGFLFASLGWLETIDGEQVPRILLCIIPIYLGVTLINQAHRVTALLDEFHGLWRATTALIFAAASLLLIAFFMKAGADFSRMLLGLGIALSILLLIACRSVSVRLGRRYLGAAPFANLCIYDDVPVSQSSVEGSIDAKEFGLSSDPGDAANVAFLARVTSGMDCVIVHCLPEKRLQWALVLKSLDVQSEIVATELTELRPLGVVQQLGQASLVISRGALSWNQRLLKRSFDLVVTLLVLPILLPLLAAIALAIRLDSPGPIFFKQDRYGHGNQQFKILKFRSMRVDMQDDSASKLTERDDPRVTRIGAFIRRTSLDELPQLFNVLSGEMSLVGPRPHAERALAGNSLYWEVDPSYWHRHVVKPGITGLAQVRGYRGNTFEEQQLRDRLSADLEYVADWSLLTDMAIILRTIGVLLHSNAF